MSTVSAALNVRPGSTAYHSSQYTVNQQPEQSLRDKSAPGSSVMPGPLYSSVSSIGVSVPRSSDDLKVAATSDSNGKLSFRANAEYNTLI